ncbi:hypothetical protein H2248_003656 [Termitomyces sp. 'cryptogamus']|nr:hypothetical protein H2248_003656 [Termitomyces sp. 'cryptogamus']
MATLDDLPWPELGNVSRGATRGNQGQKGVLGPPDSEGRCVLQLRVQPGVLAVRLNHKASDWYRILDGEVNRALKLTKTYWRKARRRQDYDARADQDHMELHEWLQQLKDKTMSHLELLMQKGDIQGPPYMMPDDIEITFLRKFIERQANGIPHNPRLRNPISGHPYPRDHLNDDSITPEPSDASFAEHQPMHDQSLQAARNALSRAHKDTQDALVRYNACLESERQAQHALAIAEKRRDEIMGTLLTENQSSFETRSRNSSFSGGERRSPSKYHTEDIRTTDSFGHSRITEKLDWTNDDQDVYTTEPMTQLEDHVRSRKHLRTWEQGNQIHNGHYGCEVQASYSLFTYG